MYINIWYAQYSLGSDHNTAITGLVLHFYFCQNNVCTNALQWFNSAGNNGIILVNPQLHLTLRVINHKFPLMFTVFHSFCQNKRIFSLYISFLTFFTKRNQHFKILNALCREQYILKENRFFWKEKLTSRKPYRIKQNLPVEFL